MQIQLYNTDAVFSELQDIWNPLLERSNHNLIFLTLEWQRNWWAAYNPGQLYVLKVSTEQGEPVAIAPWFIEDRESSGRTIRSIGCVDVTDYLEIITDPAYHDEIFDALSAYLVANKQDYDCLDLCNIPEGSAILTGFVQALEDKGVSVTVQQQEVCPIVDLPDSWDAYLEQLDKKQRHELRRKLRKARGTEINWYIVDESHDLEAELKTFLRLMRTASEKKTAFLEDERHITFFKSVTRDLAAAGWLQLAFIQINGEYAAGYINFDHNNEILVYNSGLDLSVGASFSPGILLLMYLIQHAIEAGHQKFDFLRGDEHYKYRMGGQDFPVFMLHAEFSEEPVRQ